MADNPFSDLIPPTPASRINDSFADLGGGKNPFSDLIPEQPKKTFGLSDTWPARLAKDVYDAVTLPGDAMQGKFAVQPEKPGWVTEGDIANQDWADQELIRRSGELAGLASPVSPAARIGLGWAGALKTKDAPAPTREALEASSNAGYDAARGMPFEVESQAVRDWAAKAKSDLEARGTLERFAPDTHEVLNTLQGGEPGAVATGGNLISAREALREASRNFTNPREKGAAERVIRDFDQFVGQPPEESILAGSAPAFAERAQAARSDYAALKRSEQIAEALRAADLQAGASHSGQNLDNATRQRFKSILLSDKNSAGYSPDEIAQMERVVKGSPVADAARYVGNLLGGGGGLGAIHASMAGAGAGLATGGPVAAAVGMATPVVGYGMKKLANALTNREVNKLDEMVRMRSALGNEMPDRAIAELNPRQQLLARYLMMQAPPVTESITQQ